MELTAVGPTERHVEHAEGPAVTAAAAERRSNVSVFRNSRSAMSQSSAELTAIPSAQKSGIGLPKHSDAEERDRANLAEVEIASPISTAGLEQSFPASSVTVGDAAERSPIEYRKRGDDSDAVSMSAKKKADRGKRFMKRRARRLFLKGGECNVTGVGIKARGRMYVADLFTTLVEMRWRYQVVLVTTQFAFTWLLFGTVYYAIAVARGDIHHAHNATLLPCVINLSSYASAVFFSMESQSTIGYGDQVPDPACQIGMFVVMIQCCIGTFVQLLAAGIFFTKISRPKGRAKTVMFSRNAVISLRDGQSQLMVRVGDMRHKSHIIGTSIRALMVRNRLTADGELIPMCHYPLALHNETSPVNVNFLFMVWPVTIAHKIDESSPLWDISAEQLIAEKFEIIVIVEGTAESTGSATQIRTSYSPSEIVWGRRLAPLMTYHAENGRYKIDYERFHDMLPVAMPDFSAKLWSMGHTTLTPNHSVVASDYQAGFATGAVEPVPQARRIINKIFRRRPTIDTGVQWRIRQLDTQQTAETEPSFIVLAVADPSKPVVSLTRRSL